MQNYSRNYLYHYWNSFIYARLNFGNNLNNLSKLNITIIAARKHGRL